jgi:6-phosphogluconolactonase
VHIFLGDERYVPPSHALSNEGMIRGDLIDRINLPADSFHPVFDPGGWQHSASAYDELLHRSFDGQPHTFDLAIQGLGQDGHTASIFPNTPAESDTWVLTTEGPSESRERISVSLGCLAMSREIMFVVSGTEKAAILRDILSGSSKLPAAVLMSKAKTCTWWVDAAAASLL